MTFHDYLTKSLLKWNLLANKRKMPWKGVKDPYKIWLSEIILQQTRVLQGWAYYEKFLNSFPNIHDLANAGEQIVYKHWEGLGYYSRCKNLMHTAQYISKELNGVFPDNYNDLIKLKGVGSYTASAIASFAYNLPHAVVDGNVFRVLSRFFGIADPIDTASGKKIFTELAHQVLSKKTPALYNQAIMDFGAEICKPQIPLCGQCPLNKKCFAFNNDRVKELPVKVNSIKQKKRWFNYIILKHDDNIYIEKRNDKDIWQNLHQFFLIETAEPTNKYELLATQEFKDLLQNDPYEVGNISKIYKQKLTHQTITAQFLTLDIKAPLSSKQHQLIAVKHLDDIAFPKIITTYLQDKNVSLNLL